LVYVESWVDSRRLDLCSQLMETADPSLFETWIASWRDALECEVVPHHQLRRGGGSRREVTCGAGETGGAEV
jgi:hypothetical protein